MNLDIMSNLRATNQASTIDAQLDQRKQTHSKPSKNAIKFFVEAPGLRLGLSKQQTCHEFPQKMKLQDLLTALNLPASKYLFQLGGKPLCNEKTLGEAKVQPYQTLRVALPLVGGSKSMNLFSASTLGVSAQASRINAPLCHLANDEQKAALKARLSKTDFYLDLPQAARDNMECIFDVDQIQQVMKINLHYGYDINLDAAAQHQGSNHSEDDDGPQEENQNLSKERWIIKAFNMASRNNRLKLIDTYNNKKGKNAVLGMKEIFDKYLMALYKKEGVEFVQPPMTKILSARGVEETKTDKQQQQEDRNKSLETKWASSHHLSEMEKLDVDFIREMVKQDPSGDKKLLIPLPTGMRMLPIIENLHWKQKMRILDECREDEGQASTFLKAIRSSPLSAAESLACNTLQQFWSSMDSDCQHDMIKAVEDLSQANAVEDFVMSMCESVINQLQNDNKLDLDDLQEKRETFQQLWNCLVPILRRKIAKGIFGYFKFDVQKQTKALTVYNSLDHDSRAELHALVDEHHLKNFYDSLTQEDEKQDDGSAQEKLFSEPHIKSESLHHRYFQLREKYEENKKESNDDEDQEEMSEFKKHLQDADSEMKASWRYVPFDMAGDFLQTIPVPGKTNQFITVQPYCQKTLDRNFQVGVVQNKDKDQKLKKPNHTEETLSIEQTKAQSKQKLNKDDLKKRALESKTCKILTQNGDDEQVIEGSSYSIISFWNYDYDTSHVFQCYRSFMCPSIHSFSGISQKAHRKKFLFQGNSGEVFFFCQAEKTSAEHLYLCEINLDKSQTGHEFSDENVTKHKINQSSQLYKFMVPNKDVSDCRKSMIRFHQSPPKMFDAGPDAGKFVAFSFTQLHSKAKGPILNLFSLKDKKEVLQIQNAEVFIDFIGDETPALRSKGKLYFLSDAKSPTTKTLNDFQSLKKAAKKLVNPQITALELDLTNFLGKEGKEQTTVLFAKDGELTCQKTKQTYDKQNYSAKDADAKILQIFSRESSRVVSIEPTFRNEKTQELYQVCVTTADHMRKSLSVYLINLRTEGGSELVWQNKLENGPFQASFVVNNRPDRFSMIQTVKEEDNVQQIQFHVFDDSALDGVNLQMQSQRDLKQLPPQKMVIPYGKKFLPQELLLDQNGDDLLGCYLDKQDFAVHMFHEKLSGKKLGNNYQTQSCLPLYEVEYPLLCYTGPYPDKSEIRIVNLADKTAPRVSLQLKNLQVQSFVKHRSWSDQTRICFLAKDKSLDNLGSNDRIVINYLDCERIFQKKLDRDLSYYSLQKEWLGEQTNEKAFRKLLANAIKIETVSDLTCGVKSANEKPTLVIQSEKMIYLFINNGNSANLSSSYELIQLCQKGMMKKVRMKRGFNNTFYYAEYNSYSGQDVIKELKIEVENNRIEFNVTTIHELLSGSVVALEMNNGDERELDSGIQSDGSFGVRQVNNKLFYIDDSHMLKKLNQGEHEYQVIDHENLAELPSLALVLRDLTMEDFSQVSVTERCITINNKTVNMKNDHPWDFSFEPPNESKFSSDSWKVSKTQSLDNTHRQLMIMSRRKKSKSEQGYDELENAFLVKPLPGSRKLCLVGNKGLMAIQMIQFISNDLLLLKMHGNYWTCLDTRGQVQEIDPQLYQILIRCEVIEMTSRRLHETNQVILLLNSPTMIFSLLFDHRGHICKINKSDKFLLKSLGQSDAIESSVTVLLSDEGQFYRICNISQKSGEFSLQEDKFLNSKVVPESDQEAKPEFSETDEYLCNNLDNAIRIQFKRKQPVSTNFVICSDYLCWQDPEQNCIVYYAQLDKFKQNIELKEFKEFIDLSAYIKDVPKDLKISAAPISTHLSQRSQDHLDFTNESSINKNLLQITIRDRAIVVQLPEKDSKQQKSSSNKWADRDLVILRDFSQMGQLANPEQFICSEVNIRQCSTYKVAEAGFLYRLSSDIVVNKANDFYINSQQWRTVKKATGVPVLTLQDGEVHAESGTNQEPHMVPARFFGAYRTYCEADYAELKRIYKGISKDQDLGDLDERAILSLYQGKSIFAMEEDSCLYSYIADQLANMKFISEQSEQESEIESNLFKRLYQILITNMTVLKNKQIKSVSLADADVAKKPFFGMFSILEMIPYRLNAAANGKLLSIANMCNQSSVISFCDMQADFEKLLKCGTSAVVDLLSNSFYSSEATTQITELALPPGETTLAFSTPKCLISQDEVEAQVTIARKKKQNKLLKWLDFEDTDVQTSQVECKLLDLGWMYSNRKSFLDFVLVMDSCKRKDLLMTEFVKTMLNVFWDEHKRQIFLLGFVPYLLYLSLILYYFVNVVCNDELDEMADHSKIGYVNLVSVLYQINLERKQLFLKKHPHKFLLHFTNPVNIADLIQYTISTILIVMTIFQSEYIDISHRRMLCAVTLFLAWTKMFEWLKMFDTTSYYIKLISETIYDIIPVFFFIFPLFLLMIGSSMYILNQNRDGDEEEIMGSYIGFWFLDIMIEQYLLSLGEFEVENFANGPQKVLCYFFFMLATLLTMVTALNMIIAIMGDTYGRVAEGYEMHSRASKISLLSDYVPIISKENGPDSPPYDGFLVVLTSVEDTGESNEWEGSINTIKKVIETSSKTIRSEFSQHLTNINDRMDEQGKRQAMLSRDTSKKIGLVSKDINAQFTRIDEMLQTLSQKIDK